MEKRDICQGIAKHNYYPTDPETTFAGDPHSAARLTASRASVFSCGRTVERSANITRHLHHTEAC